MSDENRIKFTYGNASAHLSNDNSKLEYDGEDKNKLRAGLQNIFNAIKKLDNPEGKKIDSNRETELLNKLQSIFTANGESIDDDEMAWAKGFVPGGDVVSFINTKYNEVVGEQQGEGEGEVEDKQGQEQVVRPTVTNNHKLGDKFELTSNPDLREHGYVGEYIEDNKVYQWTPQNGGEALYEACVDTDIEGDNIFTNIVRTKEEALALKEQIEAELAKIKGPQENETEEAAAARMAENVRAIETVAALANFDKTTLVALIEEYMTKDDFVDPKSAEYNDFVQRLIETKNPDVVQSLGLVTYNRFGNVKSDIFRGNEDTYKKLVSLYTEIRAKESRGERLNDDEKTLKSYFQTQEVNCGFRYDNDLRMVYDGQGNIKYQGTPDEFYGTGSYADPYKDDFDCITVIAGGNKELVIDFQNDYRAALKAIEEASEEEKEEVKKVQFKALIKKYADVKDDSFACSVLTSHLLNYADIDDIKAAINANGAEYLGYLNKALKNSSITLTNEEKNELRKYMVNRAVEIYTNSEKGNVSNMRFVRYIVDLINNTTFDPEDEDNNSATRDDIIYEIYAPYFDITGDEDGNEIATYTGRRMTAEEAKGFLLCLDMPDNMQEAILRTMTLDDLQDGEWGVVAEQRKGHVGLTDSLTRNRFAEFVDEMKTPEEVINFVKNLRDRDDDCPYDKIMEKFGDDEDVRKALVLKMDKGVGISDENKLSLLKDYIKTLEDGSYAVDTDKLNESGVPIIQLARLLPWVEDIGNDNSEYSRLAIALLAEITLSNLDALKALSNRIESGPVRDCAFVAAIFNKLEAAPIKENFDYAIKAFDEFDLDKKEILIRFDISNMSDEEKKYAQNYMYSNVLKDNKLSTEDLQKAIDNGWIENIPTLHSYRKNRTVDMAKNMFRIGDHQFEILEDGRVAERSEKGTQAGLNILDGIKGLNTADGPQHQKAREELSNIDKDSVVDTILAFNAASVEYSDGTRIMEYLDGERRGMTVEYMKKVPLALIEWGKANGKDTSELEGIMSRIGNDADNSFPDRVAQELDNAMLKLINS